MPDLMASRKAGPWGRLLIKVGWQAEYHPHPETDDLPKEIVNTYGEILGRIHYHIDITRHRSLIYHHLSRVLLWITPIASGTLTVFIGENSGGYATRWAFYLSCAVTILTAMNSTIHPFEVALSAEKFANHFWKFHTELELEVERACSEPERDVYEKHKRINQLLLSKNKELCAMIEEFNRSPGFEVKAAHRSKVKKGGPRRAGASGGGSEAATTTSRV